MKILNFGSLNIDNVYELESFPKAGETVSSLNLAHIAGGKGLNQSVALANAGVNVFHAGCVGKDGLFLKELLLKHGVNTDFIKEIDEINGHAIIEVDKTGQNSIILYGGSNQKITRGQIDETLSFFEKGDYILLQNEINDIAYIMEKANEKGIRIVLNPSPFNEKILKLPLKYVDWFFVNEIEGSYLSDETEPEKIIEQMNKKYNNVNVLLTLGKKGAVAYTKKETAKRKAFNVKVVDTTAAGDTFTGYFLSAVFENKPIKYALDLATAASALAVGKKGASVSIPERAETEKALKILSEKEEKESD